MFLELGSPELDSVLQ